MLITTPAEITNTGNIRIVNIKKKKPLPEGLLYIGRQNDYLGLEGSKWANPFRLKGERNRPLVLQQHYDYFQTQPELIAALHELKDQVLGCYCCSFGPDINFEGKLCHGLNLVQFYDIFVRDF